MDYNDYFSNILSEDGYKLVGREQHPEVHHNLHLGAGLQSPPLWRSPPSKKSRAFSSAFGSLPAHRRCGRSARPRVRHHRHLLPPSHPGDIIGTPALTKEQWVEIQTKVTKGGANIIALRGRSSFQSPAYVSIEMIAAAMGGKPFRWPAGTYVHSHGFDHIMMAMETEITKDGVHYKELNGTPEEEAKLKESYAHLCKLRDEVIEMGVLPAIKDWHSINPNID